MTLSAEWKQAWRWLQTWLIAAISVAPLLYDQMELVQDYLPAVWFKSGMAILGVLTIINNVRKKA